MFTKMLQDKQSNRGFTIVELLIVIVVIAILAAITIIAYNGISKSARDTAIKTDLKGAATTLELDMSRDGVYPSSAAAADQGAGLKVSNGNTLTYVLKPFGYCVTGSNPSTTGVFAIRSGNGTIQEGTCAAQISTTAGSGTAGYQDGPVADAQFSCIGGLVSDSSGNLYTGTDSNLAHIRKIVPGELVSTIATIGDTRPYCPRPLAVDNAGNVYFVSSDAAHSHRIWKITPAGTKVLVAGSGTLGFQNGAAASARFYWPMGIVVDGTGTLYVADNGNRRIRKITPDGTVSTYAGSGTSGKADGPALNAQFTGPSGLAMDASGNLYVGDESVLRKIAPNQGDVSTIAGSTTWGYVDAVGTAAQFNELNYLTVDKNSIVYAVEYDKSYVRKITTDGTVTTYAGVDSWAYVDGSDSTARFHYMAGITIDPSGNIYVIDAGNRRIRKISD